MDSQPAPYERRIGLLHLMSDSTSFLPCPFCGAPAKWTPETEWNQEIGASDETGFGAVQCTECGAKIEGHDRKNAEESWNRRAAVTIS